MQLDVQWFVSALMQNQLISLPDAAALDRELGGDSGLDVFAQKVLERLTAGLSTEETEQWMNSIQPLLEYAVQQAQTGIAPEIGPIESAPPQEASRTGKKKLTLRRGGGGPARAAREVAGNGFQCFDNMRNLSDQQLGGMMRSLLRQLSDYGASSLHIIPGSVPFIQHNHKIECISDVIISPDYAEKLNTSLLTPEQLERFRTDLELHFVPEFRRSRYRASITVQQGGIGGSYHIVPGEIQPLEALGFLPKTIDTLTRLLAEPSGLILLAGPADHGKTTTAAALLDYCNRQRPGHLVTVESPIEILLSPAACEITRRQLPDDAASYRDALEQAANQDADVIFLDQLPDLETMEGAIAAAESGRLVIASIAADDAAAALTRLMNSFPVQDLIRIRTRLAAVLLAVFGQRLVPAADGNQTIVTEMLLNTPEICLLIAAGDHTRFRDAMRAGGESGMYSMDSSILEKHRIGTISQETALSLISDPAIRQELAPSSAPA